MWSAQAPAPDFPPLAAAFKSIIASYRPTYAVPVVRAHTMMMMMITIMIMIMIMIMIIMLVIIIIIIIAVSVAPLGDVTRRLPAGPGMMHRDGDDGPWYGSLSRTMVWFDEPYHGRC